MKVENKSRSRVIKFLNGKTFYVVVCVCFIAVGIAAWAGLEGLKSAENGLSGLTSESDTSSDSDGQEASEPSFGSDSKLPIVSDGGLTAEAPDEPQTDSTDKNNEHTTEEAGGSVAAFFIKPVLGKTIKDFSSTELQYSMTYGDMRLHTALDIAAEAGTPVTASGKGTVTAVFSDPLYGSVIEIDHGNGIVAKYCGLNSAPAVEKGDKVDSSTQLGTVDNIPCESVEQSHLHLEFYLNGKPVSPSSYITE